MEDSDVAASQITTPPLQAKAITPHDTNELDFPTRAIYVGGGGDLKVTMIGDQGDTDVTFSAVPAGSTMILAVKRIFATGTTATLIVATW